MSVNDAVNMHVNDTAQGEQDLGPLAWVLDELGKSLDGAVKALRRFVHDAELARESDLAALDAAPLRIARQQLHQASGALEMVGMDSPALVLRAMESAVQKFVQRPEMCTDEAAGALERASFALSEYLESVLAGKAVSPVTLFPQYRDVQALTGVTRVHPADLWPAEQRFREPALVLATPPLAYGAPARSRLDQAVLKIVKEGDLGAARDLRDLSLGFAAGQGTPQARSFWKVCAGFFEAFSLGLFTPDLYVKRAASRVLMQYATLAKGDDSIAERLVQDLLFFCAQARVATPGQAPALEAVQAAFALERFAPVDYEARRFGRFDPAVLAQARKRIAAAAETWSALAGGDRNKFKPSVDQFSLVCDSLRKLHRQHSESLVQALTGAVESTARSGEPPSAALAMEVATSVLYLQAALEELDTSDAQMVERAGHLAERLRVVREGAEPEPLEPWMEDLYRRVSDTQTMGSVVGELRATLGEAERAMDQFFRHPENTTTLATVPGYLAQMRGVLSVLGLDQASLAAVRMRDVVERLLVDPISDEAERSQVFEKLGNNLGALGFLIDMLSYQRALARKLFVYDEELGELRSLMGRSKARPGSDALPAEPASPVPAGASAQEPAAAAPDLVMDFADTQPFLGSEAAPPVALADTAPQAPAQAPLEAPALSPEAAPVAVSASAPEAAQPAAPASPAAPAAPAAHIALREPLIDDELLEVFLEEVREVVDNGFAALAQLRAEPGDLSEQTTLRRAFHTLKGSSRMVGLNDFGEAAWSMEQLLNAWLAEQKPMQPPLLQLTQQALQGFARWAQDIGTGDASAWQPAPFVRSAQAMRDGQELTLELPQPASAGAAPAVASTVAPAADSAQQAPADALPLHTADLAPPQELLLDFDLSDHAGEALAGPSTAPDEAALPSGSPQQLAAAEEIDFSEFSAALASQEADAGQPEHLAQAQPEGVEPAAFELEFPSAQDLQAPADWQAEAAEHLHTAQSFEDAGLQAFELAFPPSTAPEGLAPEELPEEDPLAPADELQAPEAAEAQDLLPAEEAEPAAFDLDLTLPPSQAPEDLAPAEPSEEDALAPAERVQAPADDLQAPEESEAQDLLPAEEAELAAFDLDLAFPPAAAPEDGAPEELPEEDTLAPAERAQAPAGDLQAPEESEAQDLLPAEEAEPAAFDLAFASPAPQDTLPEAETEESALPPADLAAPAPGDVQPGQLPASLDDDADDDADSSALPVFELDFPPLAAQDDEAGLQPPEPEPQGVAPAPEGTPDDQPGMEPAQESLPELLPEALGEASAAVQPAPAQAEAAPAQALGEDDATKVIGTLRIGLPLYNVYLNEADEWSRRLVTCLQEWALELHQPLPDMAIALAHSLAGSSATVGFEALSDTARLLEHALTHVQMQPQGLPEQAEVFIAASEDIRRLLHQFAAGFLKEPQPQVHEQLRLILQTEVSHTLTPPLDYGEDDWQDSPPAQPWQGAVQADAAPEDGGAQEDEAPAPAVLATPLSGLVQPAPEALASLVNDIDDDIDAQDVIDPDLFQFFEEEALELLPGLGGALRQWAARPGNLGARSEVLRALHTLKGSARLAGAMRLGEMSHRLESAIEQLDVETVQSAHIEPLLGSFDALQANFDALRALSAQAPADVVLLPVPEEAPSDAAASAPLRAAVARPQGALKVAPMRTSASQSVRVRAQLLDRLVNQAGEVMITRSRLQSHLGLLKGSMSDLSGNLERLRQQLRDIEMQSESQMQSRLALSKESASGFDPLEFDRFTRVQELTRMMAESVNDVATVQRTLQRALDSTEDDLIAQGRQARELQRDLLRTRMVEFEGISERLYGVVRQASKESGKQIKLDITGGSIEMDRGVLDRMTPAFEHLLRNCVAHGIEAPEVRVAAGKAAVGTITVDLRHEGNDVSVEFRDDGAGLDLARIRAKARGLGLIDADAEVPDAEAANLIFTPGFTTASEVTEISGRGIGMDVVRSEINALGGRIETSTQSGQGTAFRMVLPLTTAVTQVVMLRSGELSLGVPASLVEIVRRVPAADLQAAYRSGQFEVAGERVPFYWSGALLQASASSSEAPAKTQPVVVLRSASQRIAMHIDEVLGNQEVVVKNLGPQLSRLPGLAGMSVLASGAVVLIYNPVALSSVYGDQVRAARSADQAASDALLQAQALAGAPAVPAASQRLAAGQVPLVLVVDDSITVRRVTQRLLQREGYRVALAADGLQALERLQEERPTVVLSDIEMPRMDGFDLARNIRADAALADLPIIMITSRIAQKHREHAMELGVNHYLGKPYSDEELLSLVQHYARLAASADVG